MPRSHCLHCIPISENSIQQKSSGKNMPGSHLLNYKYPCGSVKGGNLTSQGMSGSHYLVCILLSIINIMKKPSPWKVLWRIAITSWIMIGSRKWHRSMPPSMLWKNIEILSIIKYMSPRWGRIQESPSNLLGRFLCAQCTRE